MNVLTFLLFFVYTWGLGFTVTFFLKNSENFLERNLMRLGIGLGLLVVLGVLLDLIGILLDWRIFLIISLIIPAFWIIKNFKKLSQINKNLFNAVLTKSNIFILIVLVLFVFTFFMYHKGAFSYPWLEDDDPWEHALGAKFVSLEKIAHNPLKLDIKYIDPYPPAYDMFMGIMHQTNDSLSWTLKFFNVLIISLSIIFFYFFVKEFVGNSKKALFATFVLTAIPCYLSHFIWAHALVLTLFFPAMYCLEMIKYDKKWTLAAILVVASIVLTQPTTSIKLGVMFFIYFIVKSVYEKRFLKEIFFALIGGLIISLIWWYNKLWAMFFVQAEGYNLVPATGKSGFSFLNLLETIIKALPPNSGTATRVYNFSDFFIAQKFNMINNPIGIGIFISLLTITALVIILIKYKSLLNKENSWLAITLIWFLFTFLGINTLTFHLPIGFYGFRFWSLLTIPVAILVADGSLKLMALFKKFGWLILLVLVIGIISTSLYQKYTVNTAQWNPGQAFPTQEDLNGYLWVKDNIPANTKIYAACQGRQNIIAGIDQMPGLEPDDFTYYALFFNQSAENNDLWLKKRGYQYFVIDSYCVREFGLNQTNIKIQELVKNFALAYSTQSMILFRV